MSNIKATEDKHRTKFSEESSFVTAKELALLLNVSSRTLSRWHRLRKGPARVQIGHMIYYRAASVTEWLVKNEVRVAD
jgi:predicted DNA-binding transcriptional regulator AlpA